LSISPEGKTVYQQGRLIGDILMFERRGATKAKKNEDEWNFGMTWWEDFGGPWGWNLYLWHSAEVTYLGMGIRKGATVFGLPAKKP